MRRATACAAALLMTAVVGAWALEGGDWGVTLDSATTLRHSAELDEQEWGQRVRAALWGELFWQLDRGGRLRLTGEGSYVYTDDRDYLFDIDRLRIASLHPGAITPEAVLAVEAGRFGFKDPSGLVLNHTADGLRAALRLPVVEVELGGAYTGLLLNPSSQIRMTPTDRAEEGDDDEYFGPKRVLGQLNVRFGDLPGRQSVTAGILAQWDLRDDDQAFTLNSQYYSLAAAGTLAANLFHSTFITLSTLQAETGGESDSGTALLLGTRLRYLREDWLGSRLSAGFNYASGAGDNLDPFVAINDPASGTVFQPRLTNLMTISGGYAVRPWFGNRSQTLSNIEFSTAVRAFLRARDDQPLEGEGLLAGLILEDSKRYAGSEFEWAIRARLLPDLGAALTTGVFVPGDGAVDAEPEFLGRLEVSVSL
ncbi:MAG: hypothetical protein EA384_12545 [Spirochaetaceae bacterium]|nr:MAG: hypothetical protein EA384_12545 [Spirochaetaceae bacterium]